MKTIAERIAFSRIAATIAPNTVPVPPKILTPPTTADVITVSSRPGGGVA
jgi:hypothetical protein